MTIVNRSLRVMHIVSGDLWAGAEAQAFTLLRQLNHEVSLIVIVLNHGELSRRLSDVGISVRILPETSMSSVGIFFSLVGEVFRFRPDIVHTHRQKENILGAIAFAINRLLGRAGVSVRTVHGASEYVPKGLGRLQAALNVALGRWVQSAIIAVSEDLKKQLEPIYGQKRLVLVRNGVDCGSLKSVDLGSKDQMEGFCIGIIGRLEPVKRVDIFLQMAAILLKEAPNIPWQFHIFGEGRLAPELKQMAVQLDIANCVLFHGQVNSIAPYLVSLKALVMCSDHEGTPMTALEAMGLEVPIIAHKVGGLFELLHSEPRALVDVHTPEGYAKSLISFAHNPFVPVRLPNEYTAEYNSYQILNLYRQLLGV
jgi:L-malate glycosyltransferase